MSELARIALAAADRDAAFKRTNTEGLSLQAGGQVDRIIRLGEDLGRAFAAYTATCERLQAQAGMTIEVAFAPHVRAAFATWKDEHAS